MSRSHRFSSAPRSVFRAAFTNAQHRSHWSLAMATVAVPAKIRYYDLRRHWTKRIMPHLADKELNAILVRDFNRYTFGRWQKQFRPGDLPCEFETLDWDE